MEKNEEEISDKQLFRFQEREFYGDDPAISTYDAKIPLFLKITYIALPLWGIILGYYYWNGSTGWLDRGHWHQLQIAANTTSSNENQYIVNEEKNIKK